MWSRGKSRSGNPSRRAKTIFISRCLTREALEQNKISTSSEKFERGFAREYAKVAELEVFALGKELHQPAVVDGMNALLSGANILQIFRRMFMIKKSGVSTIFVTGYDPRLMIILILFRIIGVRVFAFIYDTHLLAIKTHHPVRRAAIDCYFRAGFFLARFLDGWIVLNDRFVVRMKTSIPYLKVTVGVDLDSSGVPQSASQTDDRPLAKTEAIFLLSGTLNHDNGVDVLIEAFRGIPGTNIELHIYGDGILAEFVAQVSRNDKRIIFFGRVENDVLTARQKEATCLIHLRDPNSIASEYSYPSKLIEYLSSETPVLSNLFPGIGEVADHVIPIPDYSVAGVREALMAVQNGTTPLTGGASAKAWLVANRGWDKIASDIADFVAGNAEAVPGGSARPR